MDAPWKGEKVNVFVRALAWLFIACALFAVGGTLYFGIIEGEGFSIEGDVSGYLEFTFSVVSTCYIFLLFAKVAFTGFAPKSWVPWR